MSLLTFLLNPRTLVALLAAAMIAFVGFTFQENGKLKDKIDDQQDVIEELQTNAKTLKAGQEVLVVDVKRLDEIAQYKQTVVIREQTIHHELSQIPETEDRPFADSNNLAYARILRDYQNSTLGALASD